MKLTLLGTGVPIPDPSRRGPSQVVEVGEELLLVDCGAGAMHRLLEAGYGQPGGRALRLPLRTVALTHLHSDHVTDLPNLLWAGWVMGWWVEAPQVVGPPGTAALVHHLLEAFAYDIDVRCKGEDARRESLIPRVVEVDDGWCTEGDGWRLTSFRVDHEPVDQAFGFRVDSGAAAIAISGDTRYSENLIRYAHGADVLVHEVYSRQGMERRLQVAAQAARQRHLAELIASYHTPSDEVGRIATRADVKQLVLSHLVLGIGGTPADIAADAATGFSRTVTVGKDLDCFETHAAQ